jgi:hypothetical protein
MLQKLTSTHVILALPLLFLVAAAALLLVIRPGGVSVGSPVRSFAPPAHEAHTRHSYSLTNARIAHWAVVLRRVRALSRPSPGAPSVTTLTTMTGDGTQDIVLVLGAVAVDSRLWYRVRLAILPNNSIAWVPRSALGPLYSVTTHLYVDLVATTATLKRRGVTIFTTTVGVGRPGSPTPRGQFYVRDKLNGFHDPFYGPVAFGTSARSATLTDWPGGGYIGVHGTDEPRILPGRVSHGCVRMRNAAILMLARLMPVGTPVTIS